MSIVIFVRAKINITIDEKLLALLQEEAEKRNLSLSRLIENKLKGLD
jgi:predicted HicB family RNase H-like nuclease